MSDEHLVRLIAELASAKTREDAADQDVDDLKLRLRTAERRLTECIAETRNAREAVDREIELLSPSMFDLEGELKRVVISGPEDRKHA